MEKRKQRIKLTSCRTSSCTTYLIGICAWHSLSVVRIHCRRPSGPKISIGRFDGEAVMPIIHRRPGSPNIWSPCMCVMKMLSMLFCRKGVRCNCRCTPSPQSNMYIVPSRRSAIHEVLRLMVGMDDEVPRNTTCIPRWSQKSELQNTCGGGADDDDDDDASSLSGDCCTIFRGFLKRCCCPLPLSLFP